MRRWLLALVVLVAWPVVPEAHAGDNLGGLELTAPVRRQLYRVQSAWQAWSKAYAAGDRDAAANQLEQILLIANRLGMERMPDLSNAAVGLAVASAQNGDMERAAWALETARKLDDSRPETAFAEASIARVQGDWQTAFTAAATGVRRTVELPLARRLLLQNGLIWGLVSLLAASVAFLALLMATRGGTLFYDMSRLFSPPLPRLPADLLTLALLLWPLLLPAGLFWLLLYWSLLLWGYGSASERGVLIFAWILLGLTPVILAHQQRSVRLAQVPPARLIDHLESRSLYGAMFSDLEVLRSMLPDDATVTTLVADLHRRLGQWDYARAIYTELSQNPEAPTPSRAAAHHNIGVYHHRGGDYETAVNYYKRAVDADSNLPEAHFSLAQAFAQQYDFASSHEAMARAKALAPDAVNGWNARSVTAEESAVAVDGGLRQVTELRAALENLWRAERQDTSIADQWRRYRALSMSLALLALALALDQVRRQVGFRSGYLEPAEVRPGGDRWLRALVPGLASSRREAGVAAFVAVWIPIALAAIVLMDRIGYRLPLAYEPARWLAVAATGGALGLWLLVRLGRALGE